jgi:hypothetical protein
MAPVRLHHFTGKHAPRLAVYVHHASGIFKGNGTLVFRFQNGMELNSKR